MSGFKVGAGKQAGQRPPPPPIEWVEFEKTPVVPYVLGILGVVCAVLIVVLAASCHTDDGMNAQRQWCHDQGGYIANTGWYEWKCIINGNPVYMPSPRDGR